MDNHYADQSLKVSSKYIKHARLQFFQRALFMLIPTAQGRVSWLRKHHTFAMLGEHVHWQPRKYPTDGNRLKIHDNVAIAADVEFTMHDIIHWVFNGMAGERKFAQYRGCIEIHENVFIGAGSRIMPDVSIGPNAIVAAGSLVNKDVLPGTIVGGVPATVIGDFWALKEKREEYNKIYFGLSADQQTELLWKEFELNHQG